MNHAQISDRLGTAVRTVSLLTLLGGLMIGVGRAQAAPTVQYFFSSSDTAYVPISAQTVSAGQAFMVSVFYETSGFAASGNSFNSMDLFVGFDQSNSYGTGATAMDGRLALADGDDPNAAVTTDPTSSGFDEVYPGVNELAGGQPGGQDGTLIRPYGDDILLALDPGAPSLTDVSTPTHLLDIMFDNVNLAAGPETISIYNGGVGNDATTYVTDGTTNFRPNTVSLLLSQTPSSTGAMPEPGTLALLWVGVIPVIGVGFRRLSVD